MYYGIKLLQVILFLNLTRYRYFSISYFEVCSGNIGLVLDQATLRYGRQAGLDLRKGELNQSRNELTAVQRKHKREMTMASREHGQRMKSKEEKIKEAIERV